MRERRPASYMLTFELALAKAARATTQNVAKLALRDFLFVDPIVGDGGDETDGGGWRMSETGDDVGHVEPRRLTRCPRRTPNPILGLTVIIEVILLSYRRFTKPLRQFM